MITLSAVVLIGAVLTGPTSDWPCLAIPDEPAEEEAVREGPMGISGFYEFVYDLEGGNELITLRHVTAMTFDSGLVAIYTMQRHPRFYIVRPPHGVPSVTYIDTGHGLHGVPQGLCSEILPYAITPY